MMTSSNWVSPYDLADIFRLLHSQGVNPIIVGGQAVNLWGLAYHRPGEPAWDALLPYASMDLDYFGSKVEVFLCEQALRMFGAVAVLSEPFSNSPQSGVVILQLPNPNRSFRIDILGSVFGLSDGEVASTALVWNGIGPLAGVDLKVLHPLLCLEGKLRNLYTLPQEPPEAETPKPFAQESLLGNVPVAPNLEAGLETVLGLLPPGVQKAVQGELKQLWDSTEKVPWLRDALGKAVQTAEQPLARVRQIVGLWESLPGPLRDTVVSMIPLGDGLDLIDQTLKQMQGKPVDPVIVIMAGIGLGADAGWLDGIIPDPADAANFATGFLKGAYKAMDEPAKAILTKMVKKAEKNKEVLKEIVEKVGKVSKYAEVLAKHPNSVSYLLKLEKKELDRLVADPKLLEKAVEQAELISKYTNKNWEKLTEAEQAEVKKLYRVYKNKKASQKVFSQREDVGMHMHLDKNGLIREGALHYVSPLRMETKQLRERLEAAEIEILEGYAIHHKIPVTTAANDPLAKAARELGYDVNNVDNLKQLPGSSAARENLTEPLLMPEHGGKNFHPKWITHSKDVLKQELNTLARDAGAPGGLEPEQIVQYLLEHGYEDEILKAMKKVEKTLDKDLLKDGVPWIKHNAAGEKVIATNTPGGKETQSEVG
jgi:hypothetical protein